MSPKLHFLGVKYQAEVLNDNKKATGFDVKFLIKHRNSKNNQLWLPQIIFQLCVLQRMPCSLLNSSCSNLFSKGMRSAAPLPRNQGEKCN